MQIDGKRKELERKRKISKRKKKKKKFMKHKLSSGNFVFHSRTKGPPIFSRAECICVFIFSPSLSLYLPLSKPPLVH